MAVRLALGLLCVLSLVVVASALHRMSLYQQAYGYTRLRLLVDVVEMALGAALDPDAWTARHDVARYEATGQIDRAYLGGLSAPVVGRGPRATARSHPARDGSLPPRSLIHARFPHVPEPGSVRRGPVDQRAGSAG